MKESEKTLEVNLFRRVRELGGHALKFSSHTEIGYPDRLVLMPNGRCYWVELKSETKKPRRIQLIRHEELRALGFEVFVIDNTDKLNYFLCHIEQKQHDRKNEQGRVE